MDFLSYRETGHIGGPSGKGHIRALDIGGIRRYREISHVWSSDPRVHARGWGWRSKSRSPLKCAVYNVNVSSLKFIS